MDAERLILEVKGLTKEFLNKYFLSSRHSYRAVNNISFDMKKGEILGFLGHNGAGKTTTIQMLLGTLIPTYGTIHYFKKDFHENQYEILKRVGYASGYDRMHPRLTVFENLDIVGRVYGLSKNIRFNRIIELLKSFGMSKIIDKPVGALSAGQSTCVILAKAFICQPDLVLLDEPSASLDPETAYKVRQFILKQNKEYDTSILITSHNMNEIQELCNRVIILSNGVIVANENPDVLINKISKIKLTLTFDINFNFNVLKMYLDNTQLKYEQEANNIIIEMNENDIVFFLRYLAEQKIIYTHININKPTLEDYFLYLVKGELA